MTADASAPRAPAKLGRHGRALWRSLTGLYGFATWELEILAAACRQRDDIALLEEHIAEHGITTAGSQGQQRLSPMVTEVRLARAALARTLGELKLPADAPVDAGAQRAPVIPMNARQRQASKAAHARWRGVRKRRGEVS